MQKLGFPSMKRFDLLKPSPGSSPGAGKAFSFSPRTASASGSDSLAMGSFVNLKITAEKLVKEQAAVKTDLEIANTKLKKSMELIHALEEKLQNAFNENAKLRVKQKEDEKLWKGLESKFSSTKAFCEQLTETLQVLAAQVQDAEKDKVLFEDKLSSSSAALDTLNQQMNDLSLKLESREETIRMRVKELEELKAQGEERESFHRDEQSKASRLMDEKDSIIRKTAADLEANVIAMERLHSELGEMHCQLRAKEDQIQCLSNSRDNLEKDNHELILTKDELESKLASSVQEAMILEGFVHQLSEQLIALNSQSLVFSDKFDQLYSMHQSSLKLTQEKMNIIVVLAQRKYDEVQEKLSSIISERDTVCILNEEINNKFRELTKVHESTMAQLSKENCLAMDKIQVLEAEVKSSIRKKEEVELLVTKLEENIASLSETARSSDNMMKELLLKISTLEMENKDSSEKFLAEIQRKVEEMGALEGENQKHNQEKDLLDEQVNQLNNTLQEKEQIILQSNDREKKLEQQISENQGLLIAAETKLAELRKQYDVMLESKQIELARHLKELSQRNDQAICDIKRIYEVEKQEVINQEKEKVDKALADLETKYVNELAECREQSKQNSARAQEEHAAMVTQIQQENDHRELMLKSKHSEELKLAQLQAENDLREKTTLLRSEHEAQLKAVICQHDDECRKLLEELDLQKSREERQRQLLQLQWKVMGDNKPQEDQEVHSKREYSVSSRRLRKPVGGRSRNHVATVESDEDEDQDSLPQKAAETPVSKLLKKAGNANPGNVPGVPKNSRKVRRRDYEVEATYDRTLAKRKTRSPMIFEEPKKMKKLPSQTMGTPKVSKVTKQSNPPHGSNIGDLFTEGSLNPYADDPYAFG